MSQPNPYAPPNAELTPLPSAEELAVRGGPQGLGGWLALVGIGLCLSPLRILIFSVQTYWPLWTDGTFRALTSSVSDSFNPVLAALIVAELCVNLFCLAFSLWLLALFFQRSRRFPMRYVALALFTVIFIIADSAAISVLRIGSPWDPENIRELTRSVIGLLVWGPYMFVSVRVKNTFIEP